VGPEFYPISDRATIVDLMAPTAAAMAQIVSFSGPVMGGAQVSG
jgi:hypothetical protein